MKICQFSLLVLLRKALSFSIPVHSYLYQRIEGGYMKSLCGFLSSLAVSESGTRRVIYSRKWKYQLFVNHLTSQTAGHYNRHTLYNYVPCLYLFSGDVCKWVCVKSFITETSSWTLLLPVPTLFQQYIHKREPYSLEFPTRSVTTVPSFKRFSYKLLISTWPSFCLFVFFIYCLYVLF